MSGDRLTKTVELDKYIPCDTLELPLTGVIQWADELEREWSDKGFSNIRLEYEHGWDDPGNFILKGDRPETDDEYNARQRKNQLARERREAQAREAAEQEFELYKKLKKKYDG